MREYVESHHQRSQGPSTECVMIKRLWLRFALDLKEFGATLINSIVESKIQATMLVILTPKVESTNLREKILGEGASDHQEISWHCEDFVMYI